MYLILDTHVKGYDELFDIAKAALDAGVDIFQLRDKIGPAKCVFDFSLRLARLFKDRAFFIVNDRIDIAMGVKADGVHLGRGDLPIAYARKIMGPQALIGASCQTLAHAKAAANSRVDYIGFGSVFKTLTKPERNPMTPELLRTIYQNIKIPVFAIGGISGKNAGQLKNLGVNRVAVCRAICEAKDVGLAVSNLRKMLDKE